MSQEKQAAEKLDAILKKAQESMTLATKQLDSLIGDLNGDIELDEEDSFKMLRLVLQYRLDTQNAIKTLLRCHLNVCKALGIDEHNSLKKNLDAAAALLGHDNLIRELSLLGGLWNELNKALSLTEKNNRLQEEEKKLRQRIFDKLSKDYDLEVPEKQSKFKRKMAPHERAMFYKMKDALGHMEYFKLSIEQLTEAYHQYPGLPKYGLIYDHVAGLKGPLSQFQMAMSHGITQSDWAYKRLSLHISLSPEANANQLLHQINHSLAKHVSEQKQLMQTLQNQKSYWNQLHAALHKPQQPAPNAPKLSPEPDRFENSMRARRTMNLFGH